jgi:hypothetical protein
VAAALSKPASEPASWWVWARGGVGRIRPVVQSGLRTSVAEGLWISDCGGRGTVMVTVSPPRGGPMTYAAVMGHEAGGG